LLLFFVRLIVFFDIVDALGIHSMWLIHFSRCILEKEKEKEHWKVECEFDFQAFVMCFLSVQLIDLSAWFRNCKERILVAFWS
jgi:hypothetical protein